MQTPRSVNLSEPAAPRAFHGVSFDPRSRAVREFSRDELARELKDPDVFSWIDVQAPEIGPLNDVLSALGIDLVLVSHFDAPEILPRIVERPDCLAFYLYEVADPERHLDTSCGLSEIEFVRMILVLGADYVITYHRGDLEAVDHVKATCAESFRLAGKTPGFIAFLFLQRCLYDYAHLNLANDNYLDRLDADRPSVADAELQQKIAIAGRNILTVKKLVASLHVVLMLLATKRNRFVSDEARASFHEMLQNALSVRAAVDSSRDLLSGVLASLQATAASRTSEIARVLTVLSGVLLPLTLITGIYGMNFEHMPELKWAYAYPIVLLAMAGLGLSLFLLFRRLGWLGTGRSAEATRRR
jgi:magnesium transporter